MTSGNMFHQNQVQQYQQEQEFNRAGDFSFGNTNNMNKLQPTTFNDPFCFMGNRNPMQAQSSMQHMYVIHTT